MPDKKKLEKLRESGYPAPKKKKGKKDKVTPPTEITGSY